MESIANNPPLVVIVGPTASGKTAMAMDLARHFDIEIVSADARNVYKGMDIGTAKPTEEQRRQVPHHLIDIASPGQIFTVADYKRLAQAAIEEVSGRGKLPLMVGGSGLYIYSVIYDFAFRSPPDYAERQRLEKFSTDELQDLIKERGIPMPVNFKNRRHLIGALETGTVLKGQNRLRPNTLVLSLDITNEDLVHNIHVRTQAMIDAGLENEVRQLVDKYGWDAEPLGQTIGYEEFRNYLDGKESITDVMRAIELHSKRLAKRQKTWFARNKDIVWISKTDSIVYLVTTLMNN